MTAKEKLTTLVSKFKEQKETNAKAVANCIDQEYILNALKEVEDQIECAESRFQIESNDDLIESCIFEIQALKARYRYLLKLAKESGVSNPPFNYYDREEKNVG